MRLFEDSWDFDWDEGNKNKSYLKHRVTFEECEEAFFDPHKRIFKSATEHEKRHLLIGQTRRKRLLFVVFTMRSDKVRVISARDLNKKERGLYEETTQNPQI